MTKIRQVRVDRPSQADPVGYAAAINRSMVTHPAGRWLATALARSPLRPFIDHTLRSLAAPDHLIFKALPARPWAAGASTLTIMTANLWHDWPRYRRRAQRLEAFARLAEWEGVDVLLLQEVARTGDFRVDEWLSERLGMAYVYGQANGDSRLNSFEEGVAVLSRHPLARPRICYLAPRPLTLVRRLAVGVTVKAPGGDFLAVSAHLGHGRKLNTRQLNWLQAWVGEQAGSVPAVVGGDFNTGENSAQIRDLQESWVDLYRAANPEGDGITYQLDWPWGRPMLRQRLDYLFLQQAATPWSVIEARPVDSPGLPHSDHRAVLARLSLLDPSSWM